MPYIKQEDRAHYDIGLDELPSITGPGDLNYCITRLVQKFLTSAGTPRYTDYNAAVGALECAKLELYRRMIAPYEDVKIKENGDVAA